MNDRTLLRICGICFCLLAVSNFTKFLEMSPHQGFMLFGMRQRGFPNFLFGWLFGIYLLVYGIGVLRERAWALPMGVAYAVYVVLNLILFTVRDPTAFRNGLLFGLVYSVVAIGVSGGTAYLLAQRRAALT